MKKHIISILIFFSLLFPEKAITQLQPNVVNNKKNVLFIIADDLSNIIFSKDFDKIVAPNIKSLAAEGVVFQRAYCQAPLCNPSRASLMTGRRPQDLRIWNNDPHFRGLNPRIVTLPQYFKQQGYYSVGIGKIFHNWEQAIDGDSASWSEPQQYHWAAHFMDWYTPGKPYGLQTNIKKGPAVQHEDVPDEAYLDGRIADAAVNKLRLLKEVPFFMGVGFWKPHLPFNAPQKYWDLYDRNNLPPVQYNAPVAGIPDIAYVNSNEARSYTDIPKGDIPITEEKQLELRHGYLAAISFLDAQVGKVLNELKKLQLDKNTIIVFTADNGFHAGEHGQFGKWTNFELGARVPLIISAPGTGQQGKSSLSLVELVDLYPTLIEYCNLPTSQATNRLAGVSLLPVLKNTNTKIKTEALTQVARPLGGIDNLEIVGSSLRDENFRYNAWIRLTDNEIVAEELYNLSTDIDNAINLANDNKYLERKKIMRERLLSRLNIKNIPKK